MWVTRTIGLNDPETGLGYIAKIDFAIDQNHSNTPFYNDVLHIGGYEAVISYINPKNNNRIYRFKREENEEI